MNKTFVIASICYASPLARHHRPNNKRPQKPKLEIIINWKCLSFWKMALFDDIKQLIRLYRFLSVYTLFLLSYDNVQLIKLYVQRYVSQPHQPLPPPRPILKLKQTKCRQKHDRHINIKNHNYHWNNNNNSC